MVTVTFIAGLAGTGKSTLGDALAESLGGVHLDFDEITRTVVDRARMDHRGLTDAELLAAVKDDRYAALHAAVVEHLEGEPGQMVVVSAPFTRQIADPRTWGQWSNVAPSSLLVWLHVDDAERARRIAERGATRDTGAPALVTPAAPAVPHLALDAAQPIPALVAAVLAGLAIQNVTDR